MQIKAFIIHLHRATDRRGQVDYLRQQLPVATEILDAVDNKDLSEQDIAHAYQRRLHKPYYPFPLSRNEIACFLSHRKAWQAIVDQNLDAGFVLEDDVALTTDFEPSFAVAQKILQQQPDCFIRFPFRDREEGEIVVHDSNVKVLRPRHIGLGMVAQIVSRQAAIKLLQATEQFDRPVDTFAQMNWITGVDMLSLKPGGVAEISRDLGGSTIKNKKGLFDKLKREILRPLYRSRLRKKIDSLPKTTG
ncbi:glycosyltransferase family 25 protein [Paenochrobactrum sp. BZR 588]|uniref:glycosyltransferase family 25 protein n=1 Tax=Paenochrobactrum TaxID=999488 RepID=UPI0035BC1716